MAGRLAEKPLERGRKSALTVALTQLSASEWTAKLSLKLERIRSSGAELGDRGVWMGPRRLMAGLVRSVLSNSELKKQDKVLPFSTPRVAIY